MWFVFTSAGLEVMRSPAQWCFPWDQAVVPQAIPASSSWTLSPSEAKRPAAAVLWGSDTLPRDHPFAQSLLSPDGVISGSVLSITESDVCFHLPSILRELPRLRAGLDEPDRAARLLEDIRRWDPIFSSQRLGGVVRHTIEIHAAMQKVGFVHRHGRPLPGKVLPSLDEALALVEAALHDGPFTKDATRRHASRR